MAAADVIASVRTVGELLADAVRVDGERVFLTGPGGTFTYVETNEHVNGAASALRQFGIRKRHRVVVATENTPVFVFTLLGLMRLGAIAVPVNPSLPELALDRLVGAARPRALVGGSATIAALSRIADERGIAAVAHVDDLQGRAAEMPRVRTSPRDLAALIATSGTTSIPKLVMQTHGAWVLAAEGFPSWLGLTSRDSLMTGLPLFHVNAQVYSLLGALAANARCVLLPRFSAGHFWSEAREWGATQFNAVGGMLDILYAAVPRSDDAENPIRVCYAGPAPPKQRHLSFERRFALEIVGGYGLSESPLGLIWPRGRRPRPFASIGVPRQHPRLGPINEARVVADGRVMGAGEVGELLLKNPAVMKGYFQLPDVTAETLRDGWLHTGDLVRCDADGIFYFVGRSKEMIRRQGENISPAEVEEALASHPDVVAAAAVGVPAELTEEEIKAFVVARPGVTVDVSDLRAWCEERLPRFKVPAWIELVTALPETPTGRTAKHLLPKTLSGNEIEFRDMSVAPAVSERRE